MKKTLATIMLLGLTGCSTMNNLGFSTMTQDMRGANKIKGNCVAKSAYLFEKLKSEGKIVEMLVTSKEGEEDYHMSVRFKDKKNRWIYLDPSFGTRDIFLRYKYEFTYKRYPE